MHGRTLLLNVLLLIYRRIALRQGLGNQHQALVVLGGGFTAAGVLSRSSRQRTQIASLLYREWPCPILFSGGPTCAGSSVSEAHAMAEFAASLGVNPQHHLLETESRNTWENAQYVAPLLKRHGLHNVMVVTSPHHTLRAFLCFKSFECLPMMYEGPYPLDLITTRQLVNEYLALLRRCVRGR